MVSDGLTKYETKHTEENYIKCKPFLRQQSKTGKTIKLKPNKSHPHNVGRFAYKISY